jgi:hypothetical protein
MERFASAGFIALPPTWSHAEHEIPGDNRFRYYKGGLAWRNPPLQRKLPAAKFTRGDIELRMKARPPEGCSFVDCNWKKRKAKFVSPRGTLTFVTF